MNAPPWLVQRPIAHRGLHGDGAPENTLEAARRAFARGFAIECDVQRSADGEAFVFHDRSLERLTGATGRIDQRSAQEIRGLAVGPGGAAPPDLSLFLSVVAARVPVICEIKSAFAGDVRLAERTAEIAASYSGPIALKSFDPDVIAHLRANADSLQSAHIPLGLVAMAHFSDEDARIDPDERMRLDAFAHWDRTRPDFLSFCVDDLPHAIPSLLRAALGRPVMTWTVRQAHQAARARFWADQIIFEGDPAHFV